MDNIKDYKNKPEKTFIFPGYREISQSYAGANFPQNNFIYKGPKKNKIEYNNRSNITQDVGNKENIYKKNDLRQKKEDLKNTNIDKKKENKPENIYNDDNENNVKNIKQIGQVKKNQLKNDDAISE